MKPPLSVLGTMVEVPGEATHPGAAQEPPRRYGLWQMVRLATGTLSRHIREVLKSHAGAEASAAGETAIPQLRHPHSFLHASRPISPGEIARTP